MSIEYGFQVPQELDGAAAGQLVDVALERWGPEIVELSHALYADPELSGQEFRSAQRVSELLRSAGFHFTYPQPSSSTAFCAHFGRGDLVVAFCVEYDALPEIGHACGHNVNAAAATGAALALTSVANDLGLTVKVLGTPAEESTGGKVDLIQEGFFDDACLALMAHAAAEDSIGASSLAVSMWDVRYDGAAAHAATAPHEGVNALDGLVVAQTAIALMRQQLPPGSVVSLIVTEGGSAANVIPDRARAKVEMRGPSIDTLRSIEKKVRRCLDAGALASGGSVTVAPIGNTFTELRQDEFLGAAYKEAMLARNRTVMVDLNPVASTDMGNVSQLVPSIHPMVGYDVFGATHHTAEFAAHGVSESADQAVRDGAYGLAMCAAAAALDPQERRRLLSRQL